MKGTVPPFVQKRDGLQDPLARQAAFFNYGFKDVRIVCHGHFFYLL
jgi:hypothetical protein